MTEDLSSRLRKIKEAKEVEKEVNKTRHTEFFQQCTTVLETVIEPALKETEQTFLLEEGPIVVARKESSSEIVLQVGKEERNCWRLSFKCDWMNFNVKVETVETVTGRKVPKVFKLEELTRSTVDDLIAEFMQKAL
jgi:hypothetical protein